MFNKVKWAFSIGHFFNDLCASIWFLFTMPFFTKVLQLENSFAGDIILIGQVADAIATPLIGMESDRVGFLCHRFIGQRKSWHLFGTILCAVSFPFIYISFHFDVSLEHEWYLVVYYTPFVVLFQIAWAIVQITHLSLIPYLMTLGQDNSSLNSLRYMFTVAANVIVLATTTLLFNANKFTYNNKNTTTPSTIEPSTISLNASDENTFKYLAIGVVIVGLFFSFLFHLGVPEEIKKSDNGIEKTVSCESELMEPLLKSDDKNMRIKDWFKEPQFYLINMLYLATRLIVNVSQVYLILYIIDSLEFSKMQSSLAALTTFISGAITSILIKRVQKKIGKKICYLIGLIFIMSYCTMVSFSSSHMDLWKMYLSMCFLGIGCSLIMIGSLSMTADLIGKSCSSSAFVYGSMSFSDKLFCGVVIWLMQRFGPKKTECQKCNNYYHSIEFYFVGGCALFGLVMLLILLPMKIGRRWKTLNPEINNVSSESCNS